MLSHELSVFIPPQVSGSRMICLFQFLGNKALELLATAVLLDQHRHHHLQPLIGGEPLIADQTGPSSPGYGAILVKPGIYDLVVKMTTIWTLH